MIDSGENECLNPLGRLDYSKWELINKCIINSSENELRVLLEYSQQEEINFSQKYFLDFNNEVSEQVTIKLESVNTNEVYSTVTLLKGTASSVKSRFDNLDFKINQNQEGLLELIVSDDGKEDNSGNPESINQIIAPLTPWYTSFLLRKMHFPGDTQAQLEFQYSNYTEENLIKTKNKNDADCLTVESKADHKEWALKKIVTESKLIKFIDSQIPVFTVSFLILLLLIGIYMAFFNKIDFNPEFEYAYLKPFIPINIETNDDTFKVNNLKSKYSLEKLNLVNKIESNYLFKKPSEIKKMVKLYNKKKFKIQTKAKAKVKGNCVNCEFK